jgi:hypothetical protein
MAISKIGSDALAAGAPSRSQLPAGTVLQVVYANYNVDTSTTSGSYVDSGLAATITPTSASSKILVVMATPSRKGNADVNGRLRIMRAASDILYPITYLAWNGSSAYAQETYSCTYLDSPATTSATTYKLQFANMNSSAPAFSLTHDGSYSTMTLMEIAA